MVAVPVCCVGGGPVPRRIFGSHRSLAVAAALQLFAATAHASLPDLQIDHLILSSANVISVRISNAGSAEVPAGVGHLEVFVDHRRVSDLPLNELADQSFRAVGGATTISTGIRVGGTQRRLAAFIDARSEILEENEYQNTISVTLDPAPSSGFDLSVVAAVDAGDQLYLTFSNVGDLASPVDLAVDCRITHESGTEWAFRATLPALSPGGLDEESVYPVDPVSVASPARVSVACRVPPPSTELDLSNNTFVGMLSYVEPADIDAIYGPLLSDPAIQASLYWSLPHNASYADWPEEMKQELNANLLILEQGRELLLAGPPPLVTIVGGIHDGNDYQFMLAEDAIEVYLAYVAQSLWFDVHSGAPWSLGELSASELANLFDARQFIQATSPGAAQTPPELGPLYYFSSIVMGAVTAWDPRILYHFMRNLGMIRSSQEETVFALGDWIRAHVVHSTAAETALENRIANFGYKGLIPADKIPYPLEGKQHISWGCWGTSGFVGATLRSVNIPVVHGRTGLATPGSPCYEHSRAELPTLQKNAGDPLGVGVVHSDDFYSLYNRPWGDSFIPSSELFMTLDDLNDLIDNPTELDWSGDPPVYNTVCEQGTYNAAREQRLLGWDYLAGPYLGTFVFEGPDVLDDDLRGLSVGGQIVEYANPLLDSAERAGFLADVEAKVEALGDGDPAAGGAIVLDLSNRFSSNMWPTTSAPVGENRPPALEWVPVQYGVPGETLSFTLAASDPDADPLTYSITNPPPSSSFDVDTFSWDVEGPSGVWLLRSSAEDGRGGVATQETIIFVPEPARVLQLLFGAIGLAILHRVRRRCPRRSHRAFPLPWCR